MGVGFPVDPVQLLLGGPLGEFKVRKHVPTRYQRFFVANPTP